MELSVEVLEQRLDVFQDLKPRKDPKGEYGLAGFLHGIWLDNPTGYPFETDWEDMNYHLRAQIGYWMCWLDETDLEWHPVVRANLEQGVARVSEANYTKARWTEFIGDELHYAKGKMLDHLRLSIANTKAMLCRSPSEALLPRKGDLMAQTHEVELVKRRLAQGVLYVTSYDFRRPIAAWTMVTPDGPVQAGETVWTKMMTVEDTIPLTRATTHSSNPEIVYRTKVVSF